MAADQKDAVMGRIKGTTKLEDMKACDFIVEAVLEVMDLKKEVFKALDEICRPEVILSSNTSSMSITEIATATKRPDRVAGMHFFNPVPLMRLVEVVRGHFTNDETVAICMDVTKKLGKEAVEVKKDVPAFIVNRLMVPHFIEAMVLLEEGVAIKRGHRQGCKARPQLPDGSV